MLTLIFINYHGNQKFLDEFKETVGFDIDY